MPPVLGTPCLEPCLIFCSCQTRGSPSHLVSGSSGFARPGWWGGRPFLLGWTVHMLIAQTRRHIFIIVIKLYCTKVLGQYLWERGGMGIEDRGWDK